MAPALKREARRILRSTTDITPGAVRNKRACSTSAFVLRSQKVLNLGNTETLSIARVIGNATIVDEFNIQRLGGRGRFNPNEGNSYSKVFTNSRNGLFFSGSGNDIVIPLDDISL